MRIAYSCVHIMAKYTKSSLLVPLLCYHPISAAQQEKKNVNLFQDVCHFGWCLPALLNSDYRHLIITSAELTNSFLHKCKDIVRNVRADCDWPQFGGAKDPGEGDTVSFHQPFTHCGSGSFPTGCIQRAGQPVDHLSLHKHSNTFTPPSLCINKKVISRWTISNTNIRTLRGARQQEQNMMNMYRKEIM